MTLGRRASLSVFAVEDTTVQLTWRDLPAGEVQLRVEEADRPGRRGSGDLVHPSTVVSADGEPGAVVLTGLPADRGLQISARLPGRDDTITVRARTLPSLPGAELARIATVGDMHLGTVVFGQRGTITERPVPEVAHPERCAAAAFAEAAAWGASHLVTKGDITNHGRVHEWRRYAALVAAAPIPVDGLPGNHDRAHRSNQSCLSPEDAATVFGLSMASPVLVRELPGIRLVMVDTTTGGHNFGHIEPFAEEVFDAVAEADRDSAVLVAMHHQLQRFVVSEGWPIGVGHDESVRFLDRLGRIHPKVLVTSGHTHRHRRWDHHGVVSTQIGSTKDYPGVWAGYAVHEGGIRQVVRRVARPDCLRWTDHTRRAAFGVWRWVAPGPLSSRCFNRAW